MNVYASMRGVDSLGSACNEDVPSRTVGNNCEEEDTDDDTEMLTLTEVPPSVADLIKRIS